MDLIVRNRDVDVRTTSRCGTKTCRVRLLVKNGLAFVVGVRLLQTLLAGASERVYAGLSQPWPTGPVQWQVQRSVEYNSRGRRCRAALWGLL